MKKLYLVIVTFSLILSHNQAQTMTDIDGNIYNMVTIGNQVWMKENLKVTRYQNGDFILNVSDNYGWETLVTGARCYINNDSTNFASTYGALYNWYSVADPRKLCPYGWHAPTDVEWTQLITFVGGNPNAGIKLKSPNLWGNDGTNDGTDDYGFSALPGRYRQDNGIFSLGSNNLGFWRCANEKFPTMANYNSMYYNQSIVASGAIDKGYGLSLRCVQDSVGSLIDEGNSQHIHFYPNPASNRIFIDNSSGNFSDISVFNLEGKLILNFIPSRQWLSVDVSSLEPGVYILRASGPGFFSIQKLIKN